MIDNSNELPDSFCFDSGREVDIFDDGTVMFREPDNSPAHYRNQDMQIYLNKEEMEAVIKSYQAQINATATSSDDNNAELIRDIETCLCDGLSIHGTTGMLLQGHRKLLVRAVAALEKNNDT